MATWNPFTPGYFDNPYSHLSECRLHSPIQKGVHGEWMFFRHQHVKDLLKSPGFNVSNLSGYFASKEKLILGNGGGCPFLAKGTSKWLMYLNGEEHEHTKDLTDAALREIDFTSLINNAISQTLNEFEHLDEFDLANLASRLPYFVSHSMMGFKEDHSYEKLKHFSHQLAISQDMYITKQQYRSVNEEFEWIYSFFYNVQKGKAKLKDNSIVHVIKAIDAKEKFFEHPDGQISLFCILFMASFETTKDSLGTMLSLLMQHPGLLAAAENYSETQINILTEELLRIAAPLQYTVRVSNEAFELDRYTFTAGTKFYLCLASANRDEEVFEKPGELMADRNYNPHLSFGGGSHSCIGARIARLEIRNWLKPLCSFLRNYEIPEGASPEWQKTIFMRGLKSLPVKRK